MKRAIKTHLTDFGAIIVLLVLAVGIAGYILHNERLRFPFVESTPVKMYAALATGQAFTPGQGQSVRVSGVQIGSIGPVQLKNGAAVVEMDIDQKFKHLIHTDATALVRPRTGLQDVFLELDPGSTNAPQAKAGFTVPVSNTLPEVNVDEILSSLDADTRSYLQLLINGAGQGLKNNGGNQLAGVLERFLPTHRDLARLNQAVAVRGTNLRRLVNSLQRLNTALGSNQAQIVQLVDASATVFRAFASEDQNVSRTVADLPATLSQTTATLAKVQAFANLLGPTASSLLPAAQAIPAANQALAALAQPSAPIIQNEIRPFVIASRPLVRNLRPAATNLAAATPNLGGAFAVLNHLFNDLGYSPGGGQHGYLFWQAWGQHVARTLFSVQDATGIFRPLFIQLSCKALSGLKLTSPLVEGTLQVQPIDQLCQDLYGVNSTLPTAWRGFGYQPSKAGGGSGTSSTSSAVDTAGGGTTSSASASTGTAASSATGASAATPSADGASSAAGATPSTTTSSSASASTSAITSSAPGALASGGPAASTSRAGGG